MSLSSSKSATGYLLCIAGGVEGIFTIMATINDQLSATLNLEQADEGSEDLDLVPLKSRNQRVQQELCNGFGFDGINAVLLVNKRVVSFALDNLTLKRVWGFLLI